MTRTAGAERSPRPKSCAKRQSRRPPDVLADGDLHGLDRREWLFEVTDGRGGVVLTFPFVDAIKPDVPGPHN